MLAKNLIVTREDEVLLCEITKKSKDFFLCNPNYKIASKYQDRFKRAQAKLKAGVPLAYIVGYKWFYGFKFSVNQQILIPRPETELLVDRAQELVITNRPAVVYDIGTGSGAIAISLKKILKPSTKSKFVATDISTEALKLARKNARALKTPGIFFRQGSLLKPLKLNPDKKNSNLLILANLPYLSQKQLFEPSIKKEPKLALYGGRDPLQKISTLLMQVSQAKISHSIILLEINYNQGGKIKNLASKLWPTSDIVIYQDLRKYDRLVEIKIY